jgi:hypothetical protein
VAQRARSSSARGLIAVVLLAAGVLCAVLYAIANSHENHSFNSGATPPRQVQITAGRQYEISTPGGIDALHKKGLDQSTLRCSYATVGDQGSVNLDLTALGNDSRTTHAVATFIGPVSGLVQIACPELSATFIDDADNGSGDPAGLFMLLCVIFLTGGAALGLSALYRRGSGNGSGRRGSDRPDDQWPDDYRGEPGNPGDGYEQLLAPSPAPWRPRAADITDETWASAPPNEVPGETGR